MAEEEQMRQGPTREDDLAMELMDLHHADDPDRQEHPAKTVRVWLTLDYDSRGPGLTNAELLETLVAQVSGLHLTGFKLVDVVQQDIEEI